MQAHWALKPKSSFLYLGLVLSLAPCSTWAGKSPRVLRDETLTVQSSSETTANSIPISTADTSTTISVLPGGGAMRAIVDPGAPAVVAATGVVAPTVKTDNTAAKILELLPSALAGVGQMGNSSTTTTTPPPNTTPTSSADSSSETYTPSSTNPGLDSPPTGSPGQANNPKQDLTASSESGDGTGPAPMGGKIDAQICSRASTAWRPPSKTPFRVTSCYGKRRSTKTDHDGVDLVVSGSPPLVYPVSSGKIVRADGSDADGYGCQIIIEHSTCPKVATQQIGSNKCYSQYGHLAKNKNGKCPGKVGQTVNPCDPMGVMGYTGNSPKPHLHFELRTQETAENSINPITNFTEWRSYKNYNFKDSSCGTVEDGAAPSPLPAVAPGAPATT